MNNKISRLISILATIAVAAAAASLYLYVSAGGPAEENGGAWYQAPAAETVYAETEERHYLAFASDRHGNTEAVSKAMSGMPSSEEASVEYVSLIGDMVGSGGGGHKPPDEGVKEEPPEVEGEPPEPSETPAPLNEDNNGRSPEFNTSEVYNEVLGVGFSKVRSPEDFSILWADHDSNAIDDAKVLFGEGGTGSGLMKTGLNSDGSIAYYIYGIAFYDMREEQNAAAASEDFKDWIDTVSDNTIPVIVVCHVPLHYARGDNKGACYWNEALNYAATGQETTGSGKTVNRDVVFLHGHNHTVESSSKEPPYSGEFFVPRGAAMEIGAEENNFSRIYYTYTTAGYLNSNNSATLITVDGRGITIEKYQNGKVTDGLYDTESKKSGDFATKFVTSVTNVIEKAPVYPGIAGLSAFVEGSYTYTGSAITPDVKVMDGETELTSGKAFAVRYKDNVNAGTATAIVTGIVSRGSGYSGSAVIQFTISKAVNPVKVKGKTVTLSSSALKKSRKTIKISKAVFFASPAEGAVRYKKIKGNKKITVNTASGKVTVKKGLKKGSYKVKVSVTAAGTENYNKGSSQATFTVKVK